MSDLNKLKKFLNDAYRESYLDSFVKGSIAYQIQALRDQLALNQTEFGKLVGMTQAAVSRIEGTEYGGVNINTLLKIANPLGIGLVVRFCNFETVLDSDVSPQGLRVENIRSTVDRLTAATPIIVTTPHIAAQKPTTVEGSHAWQQMILLNPTRPLPYQGLGTPSFATSMRTQHSAGFPPMTFQ